jgi:hypothetical protein
MNAFVRWEQGAWCADAAHRLNLPWLIDRRVPLALRFAAARALLCPED